MSPRARVKHSFFIRRRTAALIFIKEMHVIIITDLTEQLRPANGRRTIPTLEIKFIVISEMSA